MFAPAVIEICGEYQPPLHPFPSEGVIYTAAQCVAGRPRLDAATLRTACALMLLRNPLVLTAFTWSGGLKRFHAVRRFQAV